MYIVRNMIYVSFPVTLFESKKNSGIKIIFYFFNAQSEVNIPKIDTNDRHFLRRKKRHFQLLVRFNFCVILQPQSGFDQCHLTPNTHTNTHRVLATEIRVNIYLLVAHNSLYSNIDGWRGRQSAIKTLRISCKCYVLLL